MNEMYIKPYSDIFVKYLLGTEENTGLLLSFINAVLSDSGFDTISSVEIKNPFNIKTSVTEKETILDVKAVDRNGRKYDIEVQTSGDYTYRWRSLYYWAQLYGGQLKEGDKFKELDPVICINLLSFNLFKELEQIHTCFFLREKNEPEFVLTDHLVLHFLELNKLSEEIMKSKLERWLAFFKYEGKQEDLMEILIKSDKDIEKAHERYKRFSKDDNLKDIYLSREMWKKDRISELSSAKEEGIEQGIEQGAERAAINMVKDGLKDSLIISYTGISKERLFELRRDYDRE